VSIGAEIALFGGVAADAVVAVDEQAGNVENIIIVEQAGIGYEACVG